MKRKNKVILTSILIVAFVIVMLFVILGKTVGFDNFVYEMIPKNDVLTSFMKVVTLIGEDITIIVVALVAFLSIKEKRRAIFAPLSALSVSIMNLGLKSIIRRPRPIWIALIKESGFSFPSGHSITAIVFYGFIIHLIHQTDLSHKCKTVITISLAVAVFLVGLSRIYLGVHYATDVLGGFLLGGAYLTVFSYLYDKSCGKKTSK